MSYLPITGTFLDEMTDDIPSQNWGPHEWAREFDTFVAAFAAPLSNDCPLATAVARGMED